jgi:hypothetical protein
VWNAGYWGARVGFYGGINYGFGYTGYGYYGGYWRGNDFYYNRAANNVNSTVVHTTYNTTINYMNASRTGYNGGTGGTRAQPDAAQRAFINQQHTAATAAQVQHEQTASGQRTMLASVNHGRPSTAATPAASALGRTGAMPAAAAPAHNRVANAGVHTPATPPASVTRAAPASAPPHAQAKAYAQQQSVRQGQGNLQGGPPAHTGHAAQGQVREAPQRYAQVSPQMHPQAGPQGRPEVATMQGHPQQGKPQGRPQGGSKGGGDGGEPHHGK